MRIEKYILTVAIIFITNLNSFTVGQCLQNYSWLHGMILADMSTFTILVNGKMINVDMSANYIFTSSSSIYFFDSFFTQFSGYRSMPNSTVPNTTWAVGQGGKTTMCFSEPVTNPILLMASLGKPLVPVKLRFSEPYIPFYDAGGMTFTDSYSLMGNEGNSIILFPGTFTCLTINLTTPEYYTNITWGLQPPLFPVSISGNAQGCGSVTLIAKGGNTYKWSGGKSPLSATNTFETSGVYSVTATDINGCTSVTLKTISIPSKADLSSSFSQTICQGESYFGYKQNGTYTDTFKTSTGCDSVRTVTLTVSELPGIFWAMIKKCVWEKQ